MADGPGTDDGVKVIHESSLLCVPVIVLRPVTDATFGVVITLSEEPRKDGFKKDQIDVTNATAADPVALDTVKDDAFNDETGALNACLLPEAPQQVEMVCLSLPCDDYAEV